MRSILTDGVAWSVGRSVCHTGEPCKNGWTDRDAVCIVGSDGPTESWIRWVHIPPWEGVILETRSPIVKYMYTLCRELSRNGLTDRFAVWVVNLGGPKEAPVQSYSTYDANVHNFNRIRKMSPMYPNTLCRGLCKSAEAIDLPFWHAGWYRRRNHPCQILC